MKLLDQVRVKIKFLHYSDETAKIYVYWIKQYILFHHKRHPADMGKNEIEQFLSYLATHRNVAASTQNQAFNALLFLYNKVLDISLENKNINALRAKQRVHLPTVLSTKETNQLFDQFQDNIYKLITQTKLVEDSHLIIVKLVEDSHLIIVIFVQAIRILLQIFEF